MLKTANQAPNQAPNRTAARASPGASIAGRRLSSPVIKTGASELDGTPCAAPAA
jgi:hypothetical protein